VVISDDDLKNRREVSADDFNVKQHQYLQEPPPAAATAAQDDLAERRARRERDPEDVLTLRKKQAAQAIDDGADAPRREKVSPYDRPLFIENTTTGAAGARQEGAPGGGREQTLAPAGTVVKATLATPIALSGGSATVIARVAGDALPSGARLVGTASASSDGRVSLHFAKVLLANGRVARVSAEAQDGSGAFGLMGSVDGKSEEPSVAAGVAKDTATDVALDSLGFGVAGSAARSYSSRQSARNYHGSFASETISLAAGTSFSVFFHEPAVLRDTP
jgi:hypothetical protein